MSYDRAANQVRIGWALNLSALAINLLLLLGLAHSGVFVFGAALAVVSLAAAYLIEGWEVYGMPAFAGRALAWYCCTVLVLLGTAGAHVAWIFGAVIAL